jgi:indole-3-glycerol phosphate synthase
MPDFLATMAAGSRERVRSARSAIPERELRARIRDLPDPAPLRTGPEGFDLITEVKRISPSEGRLDGASVVTRACVYAEAGAAAISVLTEPDAFGGSLEDLESISRTVSTGPDSIPTMRKDFPIDPYQLLEARASGAGGALLVLRILQDDRIQEMLDAAEETGLFLLLEAFDEEEIERAGEVAARAEGRNIEALVGLNCRDLKSLAVDFGRLEKLADHFPADTRRVAESGVRGAEDAARVAASQYDLALVGTALMRHEDPGPVVARMLAAGRSARTLARIGRLDAASATDLSSSAEAP